MTIVRLDEGERCGQVIVHGDTAYLAGEAGSSADSLTEQARQVFARVDDLLDRAGSDRSPTLRATILLSGTADYDAMNEAWDARLDGSARPVRATYGVGPAVPRYAIAVVVTAARQPSKPF